MSEYTTVEKTLIRLLLVISPLENHKLGISNWTPSPLKKLDPPWLGLDPPDENTWIGACDQPA